VTRLYKIGSKIWFLPQKNLAAQNITIGTNFGQLHTLIANMSGKKQNIVKLKTALQTASSFAHAHLI